MKIDRELLQYANTRQAEYINFLLKNIFDFSPEEKFDFKIYKVGLK